MATISSGPTQAIVGLADVFSKRAWPLMQVLLAGSILAVGPRTVGAISRVMALSQERQFQKYHCVPLPACGSTPLCMIRRRNARLARLDGRAAKGRGSQR